MAIGEGIHVLSVLGFPPLQSTRNYHHPPTLPTQSLKNSLPIGPRNSPLTSTCLMLSQQTFRLKIIAFSAESCGDELKISVKNNTSQRWTHTYVCESRERAVALNGQLNTLHGQSKCGAQ